MANHLYKWRGGNRFANIPQPLNCWLLASALRDDGEGWCQGPLLLLAASRFRAYLCFWAAFQQVGITQSLAIKLANAAQDTMLHCRISDELIELNDEAFTELVLAAKLRSQAERRSERDSPEFLTEQRKLSVRRKAAREIWTANDLLALQFERAAKIAWRRLSSNRVPYSIRQIPILKHIYFSIDNPQQHLYDRLMTCRDATLLLLNQPSTTHKRFAIVQD